jgi:sulfur transfer complex TusBCD TusB component (DsrH family)
MRIFVIDYGFNREGKKTNYDDLYKSINKQCVDKQNHSFVFNSKQSNNAHFFVIHQGILDKMEKSRVQELLDKIKCRWIVVDSGRGVPQKLSNDVRFVEMSVLQKMLENYDKHGIVQTLMASRWPMKDINK